MLTQNWSTSYNFKEDICKAYLWIYFPYCNVSQWKLEFVGSGSEINNSRSV